MTTADERADEIRGPSPEQQDPESLPASEPPAGAGGGASGGDAEEQGPDASELDQDPAYEPGEPGLKDLKGG